MRKNAKPRDISRFLRYNTFFGFCEGVALAWVFIPIERDTCREHLKQTFFKHAKTGCLLKNIPAFCISEC